MYKQVKQLSLRHLLNVSSQFFSFTRTIYSQIGTWLSHFHTWEWIIFNRFQSIFIVEPDNALILCNYFTFYPYSSFSSKINVRNQNKRHFSFTWNVSSKYLSCNRIWVKIYPVLEVLGTEPQLSYALTKVPSSLLNYIYIDVWYTETWHIEIVVSIFAYATFQYLA